jgi:predicted MFS family arabinose efflux permease
MIVYFAPTILTNNGFSTTAALNVSVALGATYLVMQIVGLSIVDRVGRRRLTLMIPGAAISLFVRRTPSARRCPAAAAPPTSSPNSPAETYGSRPRAE